jgi:hypothetical protein
MGNVFTLQSLQEELERTYAPLEFQNGKDTYVLRQVLRMPKSERDMVASKLKSLDREDSDDTTEEEVLEILELILRTVTQDGKGEKLVELLDHDLLTVKLLFDKWMEACQPGEASPSPG